MFIGRPISLVSYLRTSFCFLSPKISPLFLSLSNHNFPLALSHSIATSTMRSESICDLVVCGKSSAEEELAKSLQLNKSIKLPDDTQCSILLSSEIDNSSLSENSFSISSYMNYLSTMRFGRLLVWSPRLTSTHDVVSQNFCELPVGTVCVADVQFKGRGRSKNVWESPKGALLFSFTLQMEDGRIVPLVQYVVSLAMTEAIKDICDKNGVPHLDVRIKWPNDLYIDGVKVGGILCTSTYKSKKFNVSAGIGLNVDNDKPTTCLNVELQKLTSTPYKLGMEEILAAFFGKFEFLFNVLTNQVVPLGINVKSNVALQNLYPICVCNKYFDADNIGFQPLEELYYNTWLHSGQRVMVQQEKTDDQDTVVENLVTIQGLTSSGYLLAMTEDDQFCELHPDGNSFDFLKGLVRRKLPLS